MPVMITGPHRRHLWLGLGIAGGLVVWAFLFYDRRSEPSYQGRTIRQWMRGEARDYRPAVQAMGTNALPFLLGELSVSDSVLKRTGEEWFRRILDIPPPWTTARLRQYHAFLALQALGSNAVPTMIELVFRPPQRPGDAEKSWAVASALSGMGSPMEARRAVGAALRSADPTNRLVGCRACSAGLLADPDGLRCLISLTTSDDPVQRAAATRGFLSWQMKVAEALPVLIARLDDEQVGVRRVAIEALAGCGTNAVAALPALLAAYTNELVKPRRIDDVDPIFRGQATSIDEVRWAIRWAIREIDRASEPAWDGQH